MDMTLALVLGVVQGIAEFLPISSSGHLLLVDAWMGGERLPLSFNIALHLGTLLALLLYFFRDWWKLGMRALERITQGKRSFESETLLPALVLGSVPAGFFGLLFDKKIEAWFHHPQLVAFPLIAMGILMWWVDRVRPAHKTLEQLTIRDGIWVGVMQCLALIPGVSRSGSTLTAGRFLGFDKASAARFSFLLGAPPMVGAVLLHIKGVASALEDPHFLVGVITSFVTGCLSIHVLLQLLKRYSLLGFAAYRLCLGCVILLWLWK